MMAEVDIPTDLLSNNHFFTRNIDFNKLGAMLTDYLYANPFIST